MTQNFPSNQPGGIEQEMRNIRAELAKLQAENADLRAYIVQTQNQMDHMQTAIDPQNIQLQGAALSRVALSQPFMPRLNPRGYIEYPAMEQNSNLSQPQARQFKEYMCDRDRTVNRFRSRAADVARAKVQRYNYVPNRQAQRLPPVEGATRTRYVRGKGLFKQVYTITGPDNGWQDGEMIQTYAEVRAKGDARTAAYNAQLASEKSRYDAAGKTLKLWNSLGRGELANQYFERRANFIAYAGKDIDGNQIMPGYQSVTGTDVAHAAHIDRAVAEGGIPLHSSLEGNAVYIDRPDLPRPTAGGKDRAADYRDYMGLPQPLPKPESKESQNYRDKERAMSLVEGLNNALKEFHTVFEQPVKDRIALEEKTGKRQERKQQNPDIAMKAVEMIDETIQSFDKLKAVLKPKDYEKYRQSMLEQKQEWLEEWEQKQLQIVTRALRSGRADKADEIIKQLEDAFPRIHGSQKNAVEAFIANNQQQLDRRDMPYIIGVDPIDSTNGKINITYKKNAQWKSKK